VADDFPQVAAGTVESRLLRRLRAGFAGTFRPTTSLITFTHTTTGTATAVPSTINLALTTASTIADLIAASTKLQDQVNSNTQLLNQIVYVLQSNSLAST
jgi:hypothetical protein